MLVAEHTVFCKRFIKLKHDSFQGFFGSIHGASTKKKQDKWVESWVWNSVSITC